ncbi:MAG: thioesterase family protein [Opitutales bacterium]
MIQTRTEIRVRYAETDMMGIAYHGNYMTWFEIARVHMMDELGYPYAEMEKEGYRLPVLEVHSHFKKSVTFDDLVTIEATLREPPALRMRIEYRLFCRDLVIAEGFTRHAFINKEGRPVRPPAKFTREMKAIFSA